SPSLVARGRNDRRSSVIESGLPALPVFLAPRLALDESPSRSFMLTQHIALVPEVAGINASELARVSAALQKQMIRDLSPIWQIAATVDPFPHLEDVPVGYWPIILAFGELGTDEGVHCDRKGQPYALIEMSPSWSLTASH